MLVLGIESTCDETACSIVKEGREILSSVVSSQIDLHNEYGGVVPELACRRHIDVILPVLDEALEKASVKLEEIDLIAVSRGPGLIGAILIGLNAAKALSVVLDKPLIGVNHVEAHLYAAFMHMLDEIRFPCLGVVISGGHTFLVQINAIGQYTVLGQTVDDAIGEAFDKAAKILGLPYPGGPQVEAIAKRGDPSRYSFKAGKVKGSPLDFSFSGLKTGVLYAARGQNSQQVKVLTESDKCDIAAAFQQAAFADLINKTILAAQQVGVNTIVFGGGVTCNKALREMFEKAAPNYKLIWPAPNLSLDNAAMIAGLGYHRYCQQGHSDPLDLEAATRMPL